MGVSTFVAYDEVGDTFGTTRTCWKRTWCYVVQILPSFRNVRRVEGLNVRGAAPDQNLAPFFIPEEERLLLVGVVDLGNE